MKKLFYISIIGLISSINVYAGTSDLDLVCTSHNNNTEISGFVPGDSTDLRSKD